MLGLEISNKDKMICAKVLAAVLMRIKGQTLQETLNDRYSQAECATSEILSENITLVELEKLDAAGWIFLDQDVIWLTDLYINEFLFPLEV